MDSLTTENTQEQAVREVKEELGLTITIPDHHGESGDKTLERSDSTLKEAIFNDEGIDWISLTYKANYVDDKQRIIPKDDEIEEARWFNRDEAISKAISVFDRDAIKTMVD